MKPLRSKLYYLGCSIAIILAIGLGILIGRYVLCPDNRDECRTLIEIGVKNCDYNDNSCFLKLSGDHLKCLKRVPLDK
jgi:hypothetical protein